MYGNDGEGKFATINATMTRLRDSVARCEYEWTFIKIDGGKDHGHRGLSQYSIDRFTREAMEAFRREFPLPDGAVNVSAVTHVTRHKVHGKIIDETKCLD